MASHYQTNAAYRERVKASARARYQNLSPADRAQYRLDQAARVRTSKYGITSSQIDTILSDQHGRCAICETDNPGKKRGGKQTWSVDHCHRTGRIRGLLCAACNTALGLMRDDENLLYAMIEYLVESRRKKLPGRAR